ncbi:protein TMED8 isoform X2 [Spea bombifrons]|uniref:protein TMED8 isoform X2 n=1 Tax=Spea bombifrons TaxID=233779 RepID=UPI00234ABDE1|nr:protein TMED8 isoform X2 [Spea bombifrons]
MLRLHRGSVIPSSSLTSLEMACRGLIKTGPGLEAPDGGRDASERDPAACSPDQSQSVDPARSPGSEVLPAEDPLTCSVTDQTEEPTLPPTGEQEEPAPSEPAPSEPAPSEPAPLDVLMIQSEYMGSVNVLKVERSVSGSEKGRAPPPPLAPPTTWTSANVREFKARMASEKHGQLVVRRGEVVTVRVPTHPEGKRLCWEFATDDYDIGFGIYFDWTPVTSTAVTLQVSESSDEEEEDETESPWHSREGDVERGSVYRLRSRYGEILAVYRRDSHREVQAGSHEYPGEGVYLLKLDNSYSLLRNKTLYFHVYYSS